MGMVRRRTRRRTMMVAGGMAYAAGRRASQDQGYADQGYADAGYDEAPPPPPAPPAPAPAEVDVASEVERLSSLHDSGALSDEEFAEMKQKVLNA